MANSQCAARVDGAALTVPQQRGEGVNLAAAEGAQQSVGAAEGVADAGGAEPGGGGTAAVRQQGAQEEGFQQFGVAVVEEGR